MAQQVNLGEFSNAVKDGAVLADFYSETCGPCRRMAPVLDELETELRGKFTAVKVNVSAEASLADRYNVEAVPTFILFKDGKERARLVGAVPKEELSAFITQNQ